MPPVSEIVLRPPTIADIPGILDIEQHSFVHVEERFGEQRVRYLINSRRTIVTVAEMNRWPAGWVSGFAWTRSVPPWGRIYAIAVHPDARGLRLGQQLLESMMMKLESLGSRRLFLEVRPDNIAAVRLYEKAGFAACKQLPNYYGPGHPAQRMMRDTTR